MSTYQLPDCLSCPAAEAPIGRSEGGQHEGDLSVPVRPLCDTVVAVVLAASRLPAASAGLSSSHPFQTE